MLPELHKKSSENNRGVSETRIPVSNVENVLSKEKGNSSKKVRTGGGFNKSQNEDKLQKGNTKANKLQQNYRLFLKYQNSGDLSHEIKMIQKKIKVCQRKLEDQKKRQRQLAQQATRDQEQPYYDFEKVIKRQLQMQGYDPIVQQKNFDYLTNPGKQQKSEEEEEEVVEEQPPPKEQKKSYNIQEGVQKLERHYENNLKRKFERRQMFPHQACRRKTPKLYITQKTNSLNKYGKAENEAQHLFRVFTKQTTPQQIYPTIPNFAVVKDNLSKNIIAYLGDYKPFLDKTKDGQKQLQTSAKNSNNELKLNQQVNISSVRQ